MLIFHEKIEQHRRTATSESRHTDIQLAIAKAGLLASGRGKLIDLFPQFMPPRKNDPFADDGPTQMISDFDPREAERIHDMLNRAMVTDTGSLGYEDLFGGDDDDGLPTIDERVRNGN